MQVPQQGRAFYGRHVRPRNTTLVDPYAQSYKAPLWSQLPMQWREKHPQAAYMVAQNRLNIPRNISYTSNLWPQMMVRGFAALVHLGI